MAYVTAPPARGGGRPVTGVRVEAPARLHLGMLAVAGDGPRRFGGLGVSVGRPAVVVEARPADELSAEGADAERALAFARRCREALGLAGGAHLRVVEAIPPHVGLGSGTKLALAVAQALAALDGPDGRRAGAGRGGRPRGALRGGHCGRSRSGASWSRAGVRRGVERPAPLLARHPMPEEWRVVLVVPAAEPGLSGRRRGGGVPAARAVARALGGDRAARAHRRCCRRSSSATSRSSAPRSRASSSSSATRSPTVQGGRFHPRAGALVEALLRHGAAGAGQSSWGPAVYGIVGSEASGRALARPHGRRSSATRGAWSS